MRQAERSRVGVMQKSQTQSVEVYRVSSRGLRVTAPKLYEEKQPESKELLVGGWFKRSPPDLLPSRLFGKDRERACCCGGL